MLRATQPNYFSNPRAPRVVDPHPPCSRGLTEEASNSARASAGSTNGFAAEALKAESPKLKKMPADLKT